jgi:hypothetical protein
MINIAFTLCSNNYLAHAKTLGDSFLKFHPDFKFIIGLVDKYAEEIDYKAFSNFTILPVDDIEIDIFEELKLKYNITELNTAVKPSYIHFLFKKYSADNVVYIDPDILVTSRFSEVLEALKTKNIVITPHICSPIDDDFSPTDYHTIRGGIFNLGFIALSDYRNVKIFLDWWHSRVIKYGFNNFSLNMFYDQLWINYVPVFYDNYVILKHPGYNMANWNLHERMLSVNAEGEYIVNGTNNLRFFHFSSYHYDKPSVICSYLTRYNFENRPDLKNIFDTYRQLLLDNNVEVLRKAPVYYFPNLNKPIAQVQKPFIERIRNRVKRSIKVLITGNV